MTKIQNFKMYIDGQWVDSETGRTIETLNPENNEVWATVPEASAKDVDRAVKAAQNAFEVSWANLHPRDRAKYLRSLANQLRDNAEHLGTIETKDTGKIFRETKTQANYIAEYYDYFAGLADKVEGTVVPIDKPDMQVTTTRIPIGVVAAIIPWNSQMLLTAVKLAPALAMGNTVVIKASELAPVTLLEFAKLVEKSGVNLDIGTALVSSIVIGIGVDYSIHYLSRMFSEITQGADLQDAIASTVRRSGKAITSNAVTVGFGFLALGVSEFLPLVTLSWMIWLTLNISALATMILLPALAVTIPNVLKLGPSENKKY